MRATRPGWPYVVVVGFIAMAAAHVVVLASPQEAPSPARGTARAAQAPVATARGGEDLFAKTCVVCHGQAAVGGIGPALRGSRFSRDFVAQVVRDGRPGTMMSAFAKSFSHAEIDAVSRYVAALQAPDGPAPAGLRGDETAGETMFHAQLVYACGHCHTFNNRGGKVGPDLTAKVRSLTPRELFQRIVVVPHRAQEARYTTVRLTTKVGLIMTGIPAGESDGVLFFYDTSYLPPLLRRIPKSDIAQRERRDGTVMPNDYASKFSLQQLLDIVAFLKAGSGATVMLSDVVK
jgi:putative heme-binding domain-containing protein